MDEIKPRVDSIRMWTSKPQRPKPKFGDLRETKKHGKQVRVFRMATWNGRVIGYDCTGGRQNYDWVSYDEARRLGYGHALPRAATPASPTKEAP
jgi:hypothetical protein